MGALGRHRPLVRSEKNKAVKAMNLIQMLEAETVAALSEGKKIPEFRAGDTLRVGVKVVEGDRSRVQMYEGVCIARSNKGVNSNFTCLLYTSDAADERSSVDLGGRR